MEENTISNQINLVLGSGHSRVIIDALPCGVVLIASQGNRIIYLNRCARILYGMNPLGMTMQECPNIWPMRLDDTPYRSDEVPARRSLLHGEEIHDEELVLARPDGTQITVSASSLPVYDDGGKIVAAVCTFNDVSAKKEMETELAEHHQRLQEVVHQRTEQLVETRNNLLEKEKNFQRLIESNADAMLVVDGSGTLLFANKAAESLFQGAQIGHPFGFPVNSGVTEMEIVSGAGKDVIAEMKAVEIEWQGKTAYLATFRDITRLKRAENRTRTLSRRLLKAQEKERRAIGHELHDEVGGLLTGIKMALHKVERNLGRSGDPDIEYVNTLLDKAVDTVSTLSHTMKPDILDEMGLLEGLKAHFEQYQAQTDIRVNLSQEGLEERLPSLVETTVYRIVQESLTNTARYAGVNEVDVSIHCGADKINVCVEDRGCGFNPEQLSSTSSGISGIQDRVFLAGGEVDIDSTPGEGTRVSCEIPFAR